MVKKKINLGWLVVLALVVFALPVRAAVVWQDDFEAYDVLNPSLFEVGGVASGIWTPSNTASNATRIFNTSNYGGSRLWISLTDGSSITSEGITVSSDMYYDFKVALVAETYSASRGVEASYDLLIGQDAASATSLLGGPVSVNAMGDDSGGDGNDTYDEQYTTDTFSTGTLGAGDKLFIVITRVGPIPGVSNAWFGIDNVSIDEGGSTMGPSLVSPEDGDTLIGTGVEFTWAAPLVGTPDTYTLLYKVDPNETVAFTEVPGLTTLSNAPGLLFDTTYYWAVDAIHAGTPYRSVTWSFTTTPANPVITADPVSVTVGEGETAVLSVQQLNGTSFKWYQDGVPVSGGTDETLTILSTQKSDEGVYCCDVINAVDTVTSGNAVVMTKRLVAHWDFEGDLVDEVDGWTGIFTDPNEAAPAPDPAPRFIAGYAGDGFDFAGDLLHLEVAGTEGLFNFFEKGLTVACWVKAGTESTGSYSAMVAKHTYSDPRAGFLSTQQNSNGRPRFVIDGWGGMSAVASSNIQDGDWHHVVMTFEPGYDPENPESKQGMVYVNGGGVTVDEEGAAVWLRADGAGTGTPALRWDVPLRIGADDENGAGSLDGTVDEVKIWSYALTPTEVADEYTTYETGAEICTDPVAYDYNNDCIVSLADFAVFAAGWLDCNLVPSCL